MKQLTSYLIPGLLLLSVSLTGCVQQKDDNMTDDMAHDEMVAHEDEDMSMAAENVNPDVYSLLHEDERVRILEMNLPAGVTDGMHSHPAEAAYFITGSKLRIHLPDGESVEMDVPDGAPLSHEAWTHSVENIGDAHLKAVVVELKPGARDSAGIVAAGMSAAETSPEVYSVLHEDERVRILEMKLPAGASDNEHAHPAEAVYFLSGGKANIHLPNGEVVEAEVPDGGVLSNATWQHRVENVGASDIHAVIVELKQPSM